MFKASRWRSEKNKINVVFKLEFHASQVTKLGWETAIVTLVPLDVGKPTTRTEKVTVMDGICEWRKPIYEAVKLTQDPKTGNISDKLYNFIVSTAGSEKAAVIGEVTVNLLEYAEAPKPSSVSLPLRASSSGPILHVNIQKMRANGQRSEADGNGDTSLRGQAKIAAARLRKFDKEEGSKSPATNLNSSEDGSFNLYQAQTLSPSRKIMHMLAGSARKLRKSDSTTTTAAISTEQSSEPYILGDNDTKNYHSHKDYFSFQSPLSSKSIPQKETSRSAKFFTDYRKHQRSDTCLSIASGPEGSTDGSANSLAEIGLGERSQDSEDPLICDDALAKHSEVSKLELQTLRRQLVKETKRVQELARELTGIKDERDAFRIQCEESKSSQKRLDSQSMSNLSHFDGEDPWSILEEVKQELTHEKNVNANLRLQLEKTQESNSELILEVRELDKLLLEQNRTNMTCLNCSNVPTIKRTTSDDMSSKKNRNGYSELHVYDCKQELPEMSSEEDTEQYALEELVKGHRQVKVACSLEQQIKDLTSEIDFYRRDREDLEMQMEQLALDYEILKQENHDVTSKLEQSQFREQLRMQYECSAHTNIISDLEASIINLKDELEKQAEAFEADVLGLTQAKVLQEQRAIQAEESLRKTRWSNAKAAEQLQNEFESLSLQMASTFHTNEKIAVQALAEASELQLQKCHLEELLKENRKKLASVQAQCQLKLQDLSDQIAFKTKETNKLLLELKGKSEEFQNLKNYQEAQEKRVSEETLMLKDQVERLSRKNVLISEELEEKRRLAAKMRELRTLAKETGELLQDRNLETGELKKELAATKDKAERSLKELHELQNSEDEKDKVISTLNSEVATLKAQYNDLKNSLLEDEVEKENLRKEVFHLRGDLRKKEDAINTMEKKLKENNARNAPTQDTAKMSIRNKNNTHNPAAQTSKEVANLREKIKLLEGKMKRKDVTIEDMKNTFLEKERDLQNRIEELKKNIGEYRSGLCGGTAEKEDTNIVDAKPNGENMSGRNSLHSVAGKESAKPYDRDSIKEFNISTPETSFDDIKEDLIASNIHQESLAKMLRNVSVLKGKNESMEVELKEMQERYSELSLKFAEVEGERQQLVMTVRTLKSAL